MPAVHIRSKCSVNPAWYKGKDPPDWHNQNEASSWSEVDVHSGVLENNTGEKLLSLSDY